MAGGAVKVAWDEAVAEVRRTTRLLMLCVFVAGVSLGVIVGMAVRF